MAGRKVIIYCDTQFIHGPVTYSEAAKYLNELESTDKFGSESVGNATRKNIKLYNYSFKFSDNVDLPNEEWKKVPLDPTIFKDEIWASSLGRVSRDEVKKFYPNPDASSKTNGLRIGIMKTNGIISSKTIHQLVAMAFLPKENEFQEVYHKNNSITDNRVENLYWSNKMDETKGDVTVAINGNSGERKEFKSQRKAAEYTGATRRNVSKYIQSWKEGKIMYSESGWTFEDK